VKKPWHVRYSAALILTAGWLLFSAAYAWTTYLLEAVFGEDAAPWWLVWLDGMFENLQSEWHAAIVVAGIFAAWYWWGSAQSKESDEEVKAMLQEILRLERRRHIS
jgi:hypothetical protein